jgi:hypothetical protein
MRSFQQAKSFSGVPLDIEASLSPWQPLAAGLAFGTNDLFATLRSGTLKAPTGSSRRGFWDNS